MKRLKLKQGVKDYLGVALLYIIIIFGVVLVNARFGQLNEQKNTTQQIVEVAK